VYDERNRRNTVLITVYDERKRRNTVLITVYDERNRRNTVACDFQVRSSLVHGEKMKNRASISHVYIFFQRLLHYNDDK
jgi:hypothetical protein